MMKAATLPLALILLLTAVPASQAQTPPQNTAANAPAQTPPQETAVNEAVYRQANRIILRQKLVDARAAQERRALAPAAKLYDDAWELVQNIGSGVDEHRNVEVPAREHLGHVLEVHPDLIAAHHVLNVVGANLDDATIQVQLEVVRGFLM